MIKNVISWNVNGIRAVSGKGFLEWMHDTKPDVLCLQEIKALPEQLTEELLAPKGYKAYWQSAQKKGYSGVAIYSKKEPISVELMGISKFDDEGRVQVADFGDLVVINAYFPNSQEKGKRIDYKIEFCDAMLKLCQKLRKQGKNIILCGDYNIAHKPIDLTHPKPNEKNPGYLPEERAWMDKFIAKGYVDTFRQFCDEPGHYTWWSYRANARANDVGWRIDYHCVNEEFQQKIKKHIIHKKVMGSDHCPIEVQLKK